MDKILPISIVLDDHLLFLDSFSALLERLEIFREVHSFHKEHDLIQFLIHHPQDKIYLYLDYYLNGKNSLPLFNEIKRLNRKTEVIVVSSVTTPITIGNILNYQPRAVISKSSGLDSILQCKKVIDNGEQYLCPEIKKIINNSPQKSDIPFSSRELEILQYFAKGLSIVQTAEQTHLSKHTIVSHRRKMMHKAQVNSITELLAFARSLELV
ncbi:response regulator transcription factor [Echinicola rosea]|nr:response regulator transcription factor [Echinicola rosea]